MLLQNVETYLSIEAIKNRHLFLKNIKDLLPTVTAHKMPPSLKYSFIYTLCSKDHPVEVAQQPKQIWQIMAKGANELTYFLEKIHSLD